MFSSFKWEERRKEMRGQRVRGVHNSKGRLNQLWGRITNWAPTGLPSFSDTITPNTSFVLCSSKFPTATITGASSIGKGQKETSNCDERVHTSDSDDRERP